MALTQPTRIFAGGAYYAPRSGTRSRGGLFRTTYDDGQWQELTRGLPENVEARVFAVHPRERDVIFNEKEPHVPVRGGARCAKD